MIEHSADTDGLEYAMGSAEDGDGDEDNGILVANPHPDVDPASIERIVIETDGEHRYVFDAIDGIHKRSQVYPDVVVADVCRRTTRGGDDG